MSDPSASSGRGAWIPHLRERLTGLLLEPSREAEIVEELSQHLDQRYDELRALGKSDADARALALEELDDAGALARHMRPLRQAHVPPPVTLGAASRGSWLADLGHDLRYAVRALRKQPGFAAIAILTLALGIGANGAIFALVDATLLRPLPFGTPDRLVMMSERSAVAARGPVSPNDLTDWNARNQSFDLIAGYINGVGGMVMSGADGLAEDVPRQWVTWGLFDVLGIQPIAGRTFRKDDDVARANSVVLSETFWRSRFGGDPSIVGRTIHLDGMPHNVVGVVPAAFQLVPGTSIWALRFSEGAPPQARTAYIFRAVGRLKPGVTLEAASADMESVAAGLARDFPKTNAGRGVTLDPLHEVLVGRDLRATAILFVGVVGFVLLICCANVANLMLARATVRTRELAIRSALGAARSRVIRQLVTESLLLSALGAAAGLAIGAAILAVAPSIVPEGVLPPVVTLAFDARVVAFCALAAIGVGLLFGLAPSWQATGFALPTALAAESRTATGRGGRVRSLLVVAEVATAVLLLVGAGLLLRTLLAVERIDRGYRGDGVLSLVVDPLGSLYPTQESLLQFFDQVEQEVLAVPGVERAAWASAVPLGTLSADDVSFELADAPAADASLRPIGELHIVSPAFFQTLQAPIVAGRGFDGRDSATAVPTAIVSEAFVRNHLQGRSPIGLQIATRPAGAPQAKPALRQIVGVARQLKDRPDELADIPQIYVPIAQNAVDDIFLMVRAAAGNATALARPVRAAIGRVDKAQLVSVREVLTLDQIAWNATGRHRFRAVLVATFAALALVLAMVGVFGILAYAVQQRVRDFGVRRALGATTGDLIRLVAGSALRVVGAGTIIGLALAAAFGRVLTTLLFGVEPLDPATFIFVTAALIVTAMVAVAGPAWRATRIDPAVALRGE